MDLAAVDDTSGILDDVELDAALRDLGISHLSPAAQYRAVRQMEANGLDDLDGFLSKVARSIKKRVKKVASSVRKVTSKIARKTLPSEVRRIGRKFDKEKRRFVKKHGENVLTAVSIIASMGATAPLIAAMATASKAYSVGKALVTVEKVLDAKHEQKKFEKELKIQRNDAVAEKAAIEQNLIVEDGLINNITARIAFGRAHGYDPIEYVKVPAPSGLYYIHKDSGERMKSLPVRQAQMKTIAPVSTSAVSQSVTADFVPTVQPTIQRQVMPPVASTAGFAVSSLIKPLAIALFVKSVI